MSRLAVPDGEGIRRFTIREGLRLFGFPEDYKIPTEETEAFDLLGNTVAIPVVQAVSNRVGEICKNSNYFTNKLQPVCSI